MLSSGQKAGLAALVWLLALSGFAQSQPKTYEATRVPNGSIHVDGRIDPAWLSIPMDTRFVQRQPKEGDPPSQRTGFRVAYDDHMLYVLVRAYDREPDRITARLARRDNIQVPTDFVAILIDSYFDRNTAFVFGVSPSGAKLDMHMSQNGFEEDVGWDAVWYSGTAIDDSGWVAEFGIPFSQLRYPTKSEQQWGFNVIRRINRENEEIHWNLIPQNAGGGVSFFGILRGLRNLPKKHGLEVMPYARTSSSLPYREAGNPFRAGPMYDGTVGLDMRYPIGSNLSLNVAVNPDFGEVEADPSEFNLTAYETYFPEKRPFFTEGANIFQYSLGIGDGEMSQEGLFYTRRIGRAPEVSPDVPSGAYVKVPQSTPILFAAKLSGRTESGWSVGLLDAVTRKTEADVREDGKQYRVPVEPWANYFVARARREMNEGKTMLGGIVTHVARDVSDPRFAVLNRSALTAAVDFTHRWHDHDWQAEFVLAGSRIDGKPEAIRRAQLSSARYFQRPDAPHVEYDPDRTSLSGLAGRVFVGKIGGGHLRGGAGTMFRTPGFECNDMGFLREADLAVAFVYLGYVENQPGRIFRRYNVYTNAWHARTFGNEPLGYGANLNFFFQFLNYWGIFGGFEPNWNRMSNSLLRGGPSVRLANRWNAWLGMRSDFRKPVFGMTRFFLSQDADGSISRSLSSQLQLQLSSRLQISLTPWYRWGSDRIQYVQTRTAEDGSKEYILARLKRKTLAVVTRLDLTLTPELSLQFYGMPYVSSGHYDEFKRVADPHAASFWDRYEPVTYENPPHFKFEEFRSNLVLRWEYRPGSTLYLVWSQGRTALREDGTLYPVSDFRDLFSTKGDHVFLVKVSYWFSL